MLIGFNLPLSGPMASPAMLARLAAEGEAIGYDYAAISDHIAVNKNRFLSHCFLIGDRAQGAPNEPLNFQSASALLAACGHLHRAAAQTSHPALRSGPRRCCQVYLVRPLAYRTWT